MKQIKENTITKKENRIVITIDKSLDKYSNIVLFPKKLAKANRLLKGIKLPDNI